ncbi:MAG: hypothetical protein LC796_08040 [Acidobacteria bacterium]|nr:hypothetical protein [Acidobacteriota bacterium]MCA1610352.1 hypothetical protein [Acidobacteriota bacterium]
MSTPPFPRSLAARAILPAAIFLVPFLVFLAGPPSGSGDTEPAELLPISILLDHRLDFDRFYGGLQDLPYPYRRVRGRVVSAYPIVAGLANVPVYAAARIFGTDLYAARSRLSHVTSAFLAAASVLFLYGTLRRVCRSRAEALLFAAVYAFGTEVLAVASRGAWQHAPSLFFLCASLWLLWPGTAAEPPGRESDGRDPVWRVSLSGLTLALAVVSRPTNVLLALAAAAFVLARRRRQFPPFLLFAAIPAVAVTLYSAVRLANPLAMGQLYRPFGFGGHSLRGLAGLLASPSRGLFVFSPVLLASLPGAWVAWRSRGRRRYEPLPWLASGAAATLLLFSYWGMWWGGSSFGYRLVLDVVPVLTILSAVGWGLFDRGGGGRARGRVFLFAALLAISVYVEILGVFAYPTRFGEGLDLEPERLWRVRESELVLASRQLFHREVSPRGREVAAVWWTSGKNDDTIPGWIDQSPGSRTIRGAVSVSGWAKASAGEVEVAIAFDGGPVVRPQRYPRPDVAAVLPELGDTATTGFRAEVSAPVGPVRDRAMTVELKEPGGRVRRLGPIRFRWGPAF